MARDDARSQFVLAITRASRKINGVSRRARVLLERDAWASRWQIFRAAG
jgi:hypothetical protein